MSEIAKLKRARKIKERAKVLPNLPSKVDRENSELQEKVKDLESKLDGYRKKSKEDGRNLLQRAIDKHGIEPIEELLAMVQEVNAHGEHILTKGERIRILLDLVKLRIPQIRTEHVTHDHDYKFNVTIKQFSDSAENAIDITPQKPNSAVR